MPKRPSHPLILSLISAAALAALQAPQEARAQVPPAAAAPPASAASAGSGTTLEQVVITAQKRREDVRKVPLSVSVLSGEALQENRISNLSDLSRSIPNLSFSTQAGAGLATLELRGVSSQAGSATVSIYLDDVSLTTRNLYSQGTAEPRFFDIDRVEVLRGPQGTLYGASSLGGTIRFISRQPDAKAFGSSASAEISRTAGGGTNHQAEAVLNVPLVANSTALRVGVQTGRDSGWIDQVSPTTLRTLERDINGTRWNVLKLALKSQLGADWSVTPSLFHQRFKSDDIDASYASVGEYQLPPGAATPLLQRFQTSKIVREPSRDVLTIPALTVNGDLGFADFTGVLSGYKRHFERVQDGTYINVPYIASVVADPALAAVVNGLPSAVQLDNRTNQGSLELRLASKDYVAGGNPFTWVGGFYVARTRTEVFDNEPVFGINAAFRAAGIDIDDPNQLADSFPGAFLGDSSYYSARHYRDRQHSVFGELTYNAGPSLRATVGVRALRASQNFTREGDFYYAGGPTSARIDSKSSAVTPRFALSWDATPGASVYANVAKGFRLGAANRPVPLTPLVQQDLADLGLPGTIPAAFKPDSLWSYELGAKTRLLDNRLSLNVAVFHIDWKDIQQNVVLPASGFDFETNVGRAKVDGVEFEARLRASDGLTLSAGASLTRARFAGDMPALGTDDDGNLNVRKGDRIQGVPRYGARLGAEYRFALAGGEAFVRASGQWTGASKGSFVRASSDHVRPSYFIADASAGFNLDRWEFTLFAKNLANDRTIIQRPSIQSVTQTYTVRPRTIGATAALSF